MANTKRRVSGIGKKYYPVRIAGFGIAGIVQTLFLYYNPDLVNFFTVCSTLWAFLWAHVAYGAYLLSGQQRTTEIVALLLDNLWVGIFVSAMSFAFLPSLLCVLMTSANNMSVKGFKQFFYGMMLIILGIILGALWNGWEIYFEQHVILEILSGLFMFAYFNFFGLLVYQRTIFVKKAHQSISHQKQEIEQQHQQIAQKSEELQLIHHQLLSSINYAKRIQDAMLPSPQKLAQLLPEHFIFFRPRDVVSGDFYWLAEVSHRLVLAAADCTGHGVPGAFMSIIGNELLSSIIIEKNITKSNEILKMLRSGVQQVLKQEETRNQDGMDIALCVLDKKNRKLEFSGAKNPLYYIQYLEQSPTPMPYQKMIHKEDRNYVAVLQEIRGDKISIGGILAAKSDFESYSLDWDEVQTFYIFSDGYQDQFGGDLGRKLLVKNFKKLILEVCDKPMSQQQAYLSHHLEQWQGKHDQVDDILIIGVRLWH